MQGLIDRIKSMQTNETMLLAYGSVVKAISTFSPKGVAPCINMGLRYRLSRHFVVVDTPEHYTSMTCSKCHCRCGPFEALETERRVKLVEKASSEEEKKKARYHEIRGLRRCQNVECEAILHRDRNAAVNIATNFCRLYRGQAPLREPTVDAVQQTTAV